MIKGMAICFTYQALRKTFPNPGTLLQGVDQWWYLIFRTACCFISDTPLLFLWTLGRLIAAPAAGFALPWKRLC